VEWVGAVAGVLVLTINLLDGFLSPYIKSRIRRWIDRSAPMVQHVSVDRMYLGFRKHKWTVWLLISSLMPTYLFATDRPLRELELRDVAFATIWAIWFIACLILFRIPFKRPTFGSSLRSFSRVFVFLVIPLSIALSLAYTALLHERYIEIFAGHTSPPPSWLITSASVLGACIGFACIQYGLVILLIVLRVPVASVTRTVWWIGSYPRGIWELLACVAAILYLIFFLISIRAPFLHH
jgi:hypothetical protein